MSGSAAPLLEASVEIDASPAQAWAVLSDLRRMGEWSPECRRVRVLGGVAEHDDELLAGMSDGLARIKTVVERG